ncbi:MAG: hypothetical protein IT281_07470 [Ignavibacteria bacterium]|nr:YciI family protein [Ignavibacteria bacterium]MCC7159362.1 hypothetical protein [Ignavibacteria bacterium]
MSEDKKQQFVYIIRPPRNNFAETITEVEAEIMSNHFVYLRQLLEDGNLILAGPVTTGEMGICIFEANSKDEAETIMNNDPSVVQGLMTAQLYPYRVSLIRK